MDSQEFSRYRKRLNKTQVQTAQLLGTSVKAIHSYEQGWRKVPVHVERQLYFLASRMRAASKSQKPCWAVKHCPPEHRRQCPAWEFQAGRLCWFINGTICEGEPHDNWRDKMKICKNCEVWAGLLEPGG